jgi:SAM-dependent methyltransferase
MNAKKNPWLDIPLADYEGHMAMPMVAQAQMLSDIFADALDKYKPGSVAILGCAGGNGFERISPEITHRIVGVDINPDYIEQARRRFGNHLPGLELLVGDMQADTFSISPVELVFAGLLFEYVDIKACLKNIRELLKPHGIIVAVVQLPSDSIPEVTPSPFISLGTLSSLMRLVPPDEFRRLVKFSGFREIESRTVKADGGKCFEVLDFCLE